MKNLYIKILLGILIVVSCSKESDEMINQSISEVDQQISSTDSSTQRTLSGNSSTNTSVEIHQQIHLVKMRHLIEVLFFQTILKI